MQAATSEKEDFSTLFDFLPIGAYRSLPNGQQLRANPALVALNGYDNEAQQIAAVHDIAVEWYVDPHRRRAFAAALERDGYVRGFESEVFRHRSRERIWVSENAHAVRDTRGEILYFEGTVEDITQRKWAADALRDSEQRWKLALESAGDGVWDVNLETGEETCSPRFMQMYGFPAIEAVTSSSFFDERTHPEDMAQMLKDREDHHAGRTARYVNEHRVRCQDGSWKWVRSRGLVIARDAQSRPLRMIGTHTDITADKEAEALRRAREQAETADRAKTELLSRVSHELRTPLNGVMGFAQLLEHAADLPPRHRKWVAQIVASGRHLVGVVEDLLDLSSAQSGGIKLTPTRVDAADAMLASWSMLQAQAQKAGVRFVSHLPPGQELAVIADRQRLVQVFANLLSNAVKYNRPGGRVEVSGWREEASVRIEVVDSGLGIDSAQLARIFRPFERLGAESSGVEGTGLGLALSKQLLVAMGGAIDVASMRERGTTFRVTLPAAF